MAKTATAPTSEMAILRRVVDSVREVLSEDAARAILRLRFSASDKARMNRLAAKNRQGKLTSEEEVGAHQLHSRGPDFGDSAVESETIIEGDPRVGMLWRIKERKKDGWSQAEDSNRITR